MSRAKLRLSAPVVVTIGLLAGCGGAQGPDNPPPPDTHELQNPPAPTDEGTAQPHANPPGHPETPHKNPPGPGDEEKAPEDEPEVNKNPPAPEDAPEGG